MDINEKMQYNIRFIERQEGVRIVYACESGSRSWGFESPDSDYDMRFVYVKPIKDYLRLDKVRDVIEWPITGSLDVNGWDLTKFLSLMRASNPTVFEWLNSPIVYYRDSSWDLVIRASHDCFSPLKSAHHYLGMATHNYNEHMKRDSVRPKKVLYVIRAILAARHVMNRYSRPPVPFSELMDQWLEPEIAPIVDDLLKLKRSEAENFTFSYDSHPLLFSECKNWVRESLETLNQDLEGPNGERAGMTQSEAASAVGIGVRTLRDMESGIRNVSLEEAVAFAVLFGTHFERLAGLINDEMEALLETYEAASPSLRKWIVETVRHAQADDSDQASRSRAIATNDWNEHLQELANDPQTPDMVRESILKRQ